MSLLSWGGVQEGVEKRERVAETEANYVTERQEKNRRVFIQLRQRQDCVSVQCEEKTGQLETGSVNTTSLSHRHTFPISRHWLQLSKTQIRSSIVLSICVYVYIYALLGKKRESMRHNDVVRSSNWFLLHSSPASRRTRNTS